MQPCRGGDSQQQQVRGWVGDHNKDPSVRVVAAMGGLLFIGTKGTWGSPQ